MDRVLHAGPVAFQKDFFLDFETHSNSIIRPLRLSSFPFPPSTIPPMLVSVRFFVERVGQQHYLRHTSNGYFCEKIRSANYSFDAPLLDEDDNIVRDAEGNFCHERREVQCLVARFDNVERTVAYWDNGRRESALAFFEFDGDPNTLPPMIKWIHTAAQYATERMLLADERGVQGYLSGAWRHPAEQ